MKFSYLIFICLLISLESFGQHKIKGQVISTKGKSIANASISLENTLDGATSDSNGFYHFNSNEIGKQILTVTAIGFESQKLTIDLTNDMNEYLFKLKEGTKNLDGVTVIAGAFEASPDKNKTILSTMDILTTAGSNADIVKAIQTLPGTQQQGTQTGLFVRGGDASEAAIIVDGLTVQNGFFSTAPGVAARSRFMPFGFKGVAFNSGGYSCRYGQSLSSILELSSLDFPEKTTINLGINMAGVYASGAKLWNNSGINISFNYNDLSPFYFLAKPNIDFYKPPIGEGGSISYTWKPSKKGLLKTMVNIQKYKSGTIVPYTDNNNQPTSLKFDLKNTNLMGNISFKQTINTKWNLYTAASLSLNKDDIVQNDSFNVNNKDFRLQYRLELRRYLTRHFSALMGSEIQHYSYNNHYSTAFYSGSSLFKETITAAFIEGDYSPNKKISFRPGIRYEYSNLLQKSNFAPRIAMAIRTGMYSQIDCSYGQYFQNPDKMYLYNFSQQLGYQKATNYTISYQWLKENYTFRIASFYKKYQSLVLENYDTINYNANPYRSLYDPHLKSIDNLGHGFAGGIELFWRDKKSIKNFDYWISYSYIDSKRWSKNFIQLATPDYISDHNLNIVSKYWIEKWQTQINLTYSYASGKPCYNQFFLADRTPDYHLLSFTANYLTHLKKWFTVIYAGIDNVTNRKNVFGYNYQSDGKIKSPIYPALFRSVFVGVNFSLTEFKKDEL